MTAARPDVLICAGLDPSGGAGLIADVRVVSELGARPSGIVTALTVQSTQAVLSSEPVSADLVREQLELLLSDIEVRAVKIGMIGSPEIARAIGEAMALTRAPLIWDPVLRPTLGDVEFGGDALFTTAMAALAPHLTLLTPNAEELAFITEDAIETLGDAGRAGQSLAARFGISVLVKGGHIEGDFAVDLLCTSTGSEALRAPRVQDGEHVHGTGCALSSAIAAHLAHGRELLDACAAAKEFVASRIAAPARPGRGAAAIV